MKNCIGKRGVFGIKHGGIIEISILKLLYQYNQKFFDTQEIAEMLRIEQSSARGALNRLYNRGCVEKNRSTYDKRLKIWKIKNDINLFREIENQINSKISRSSKRSEKKDNIEKKHGEDNLDKISNTTVQLSPLKIALQILFPEAAVPLEVGYRVFSNLNAGRDMYKNATSVSSSDFENVFNETIKDSTKLAYPFIEGIIAQPIKDTMITEIVDISSKYLEDKDIFKDVAEIFDEHKSYSGDFKDFYKTSLSNCLTNKLKEYTSHIG